MNNIFNTGATSDGEALPQRKSPVTSRKNIKAGDLTMLRNIKADTFDYSETTIKTLTISLPDLLKKTKNARHAKIINTVAKHHGILTHVLCEKCPFSNNHHAVSRAINAYIMPMGWMIDKRVITKRNESWGWFLIPVKGDLQ